MPAEASAPDLAAATYDAQPWREQYAADISPSLTYPPGGIWDLLELTVAGYARKPAFVFQNHAMTYQQLRTNSERMSGALSRAGVKRGDVVLLVLPNVPHFPVAYYAALRLGAVIAAVPPNSVEREIEHLLQDSGARVIVTIDLLYDKIANIWERNQVEHVIVGSVADFMPLPLRVIGSVTGKIPKPKDPIPYGPGIECMRAYLKRGLTTEAAGATAADLAVLQYTGGTTGTPKAAMLTHGSLLANARQMREWFPSLRQGEETLLAVLPFFHVYGVTLAMNTGVLLAATTILIPRPVVADMFEAIRRYRPSIFPGVPTLYVAITNDSRSSQYDLSSIDVCVSGGAPLPIEVKNDFERLTGGHLYQGYGLTEASPVTHAEPHDGRSRVGSMGLPIADTGARIVDDQGVCVPVGEEGELMVRGPQIMTGYWKRPQETAEVLQEGWLRTGDIARMDADGWFYIVDRKKDIIITGGENIYPREVEEVLFEHPAVREAAVVGVPHGYGGEVAKAFIVLKPGAEVSKAELTRFAADRLAKHKVPRSIEFRDELPKSAAQKVLRRVLAAEERERLANEPRREKRRSAESSAES